MKIHNVIQGSADWHKLRIGRFTGSEFHRLMATATRPMTFEEKAQYKLENPKGRKETIDDPNILSKGALTYIREIALERITGRPAKEYFTNWAMEHGKKYEPIARQTYEAVQATKVTQVGFVEYEPEEIITIDGIGRIIPQAGYSPDGLLLVEPPLPDGVLEIKCPATDGPHADFLEMTNLRDESPEYFWQITGGLLITRVKYCDFVSYSPFFPTALKMRIKRTYREELLPEITALENKLLLAEIECQKVEAALRQL